MIEQINNLLYSFIRFLFLSVVQISDEIKTFHSSPNDDDDDNNNRWIRGFLRPENVCGSFCQLLTSLLKWGHQHNRD